MPSPLHFHFIGICGTAMGAVASAIVKKGHIVTGSDTNVYPPMSTFLKDEGIRIFEGYKPENIPANADYIVVGNAISRSNPELEAVLDRKLRYLSLPETLKEFFLTGKRNFVVTGTHGKTTTTSLLAWLMEDYGHNPSFMIGGIAKNLKRGGRLTDSPFSVLEGDEYDTAFFDKRSKFVHYLPELAIINNIEFDHADIFKDLDAVKLSFSRLVNIIPRTGLLLVNGDDANACEVAIPAYCPVRKVGFGPHCDIIIEHPEYTREGSSFTLGKSKFFLPMIGEFNVRNAAMAVAAARFAGISDEKIAASMLHFKGVARRQELKGEVNGIKLIDDFAHHPTAIKEAIHGLRQRYPENRIWVLFEPRSNTTRRKVFQDTLASSLAEADLSIVARVDMPEKVVEQERLSVEKLVEDIVRLGSLARLGDSVDDIVQIVSSEAAFGDIIAVMSNGGFGGIHEKILEQLKINC